MSNHRTFKVMYIPTGEILTWTATRVPRTRLIRPNGFFSRSRYASGWDIDTGDGCIRFVEGGFEDCKARFRDLLQSYACEPLVSGVFDAKEQEECAA